MARALSADFPSELCAKHSVVRAQTKFKDYVSGTSKLQLYIPRDRGTPLHPIEELSCANMPPMKPFNTAASHVRNTRQDESREVIGSRRQQ